MRDKILKYISENGPTLPVDIVKLTGGNSFISNAYLSELVDSKSILKSDELIGTANLYYLPGQENILQNKLTELIDFKKTAKNYQTKKVNETPDLIKKRIEFNERLREIEEREKQEIEEKPKEIEKPKIELKEKIEPIRREIIIEKPKEIFNKIVEKIKPENRIIENKSEDSLFKNAINFLEENNEIISKNMIDENTGNCIIKANSSVGPLKFYVNIMNKKRLTKSDIAEKYAESVEKKMPVIIITNAKIANTSKKYLQELGGFVRVKRMNS